METFTTLAQDSPFHLSLKIDVLFDQLEPPLPSARHSRAVQQVTDVKPLDSNELSGTINRRHRSCISSSAKGRRAVSVPASPTTKHFRTATHETPSGVA